MNGQPCIRGMRLTVRRVAEAVALYPNRDDFFRNYPELEPEDVRQALAFAAVNPKEGAPQKMLRKVGFFHYGDEHQSDPPGSLRAALTEASQQEDLSDCLIVAPEAFNIRNVYFSSSPCRDPSIKESLVQISVEFDIALVVGLVEEGCAGEPGYNSAYLIDGGVGQLLSMKAGDDGWGSYKAYHQGGWDKPVLHRGISIGALICRDAAEFSSPPSERHKTVLEQLRAFKAPHAVLCVPARMGVYGSKIVAQAWPADLAVVVGNKGCSQPSLIRPAGQRPDGEPICCNGALNEVRTTTLG